MRKADKVESVAELKDRIQGSQITVLSKYQGINVEQATELRRRLRAQAVHFKVFKNTLARRALDELGLSRAAALMEGPTAWAFCDDPVVPPKVLKEYAKEAPFVQMNGGILDGEVITRAQLDSLAELPPQNVLLGRVVGTICAPLRKLVGTLNALPRNLVNVLDQIKKQKEGAGAAA